jgi:hypothetical protein
MPPFGEPSSGAGSGHVLYLKSELTEARWRIYSDNIAMARLLQSTVLGAIYAELLDPTIAVIDAQFSRSGDVRDFWTERLVTRDEEVVLTWYAVPGSYPTQCCSRAPPCLCRRWARGSPTTGLRPKVGLGRGNAKAVPRVPASWAYARAGPRLDSVRLQPPNLVATCVTTQMMELVRAGTIAARNDLRARAALDDLRPPHHI